MSRAGQILGQAPGRVQGTEQARQGAAARSVSFAGTRKHPSPQGVEGCEIVKKVPTGRHARTVGTHTGKFGAESVRAALRRVRGSAPNFVPRGIPGGRNFCPAYAGRNGSPLERVVFRHADIPPRRAGRDVQARWFSDYSKLGSSFSRWMLVMKALCSGSLKGAAATYLFSWTAVRMGSAMVPAPPMQPPGQPMPSSR